MTPRAIQQLRRALQQSTAAFGARFGVSGRTVESWEQGRRVPHIMIRRALEKIAGRTKIVVDSADTTK